MALETVRIAIDEKTGTTLVECPMCHEPPVFVTSDEFYCPDCDYEGHFRNMIPRPRFFIRR